MGEVEIKNGSRRRRERVVGGTGKSAGPGGESVGMLGERIVKEERVVAGVGYRWNAVDNA